MKSAGIVVNHYRPEQASELEPGVIPHFNMECTRYFEATIQQKMHADKVHEQFDYFGVVSWKMRSKTGCSPGTFRARIESDGDAPDYYWVPLKGQPARANVWAQGESCHPGLREAAKAVLRAAGLDPAIITADTDAIWCQNHATRPEIFDQFMVGCMLPCLAAMDDPLLETMLMRDGLYRSDGVDEAMMRAIFGVPYYTLHPAIVERLFPSYAASMGWRGKMIRGD
jgi:hypothetical protein